MGERARRVSGRLGALALAAGALLVAARAGADDPPAYPLDPLPREAAGGPFRCPEVDRVLYRGESLRYDPPAFVHPSFHERLGRFEEVVRAVAIEVYGRPPRTVKNLGTYACRRMTTDAGWLSEHAFGNAIDVSGFDFDAAPRGAALPPGLPRGFRNGFEVRVLSHWSAKGGHGAVHARFLRTLARRLAARDDVFRVLLGPAYPGHKSHFHFDVSPFRLVRIFEEGAGEEPPGQAPALPR
jgi:hypothetical protein